MYLHYMPLIKLFLFFVLAALFWKVKNRKLRAGILVAGITLLFLSPVKFTQKKSVTPELLEFRRLDILEEIAKSDNKNAIYIPVEALSNVGAQVRMFGK